MHSDPVHAERLYQAATQAFARGAIADAEALVSQFLAVQPKHFFGMLLLGLILEARKDQDGAIAAYERAAAHLPGHGLPFTRMALLKFRAVFGPPLTPRVRAPNDPVVSMTALGANGRFGNQLLQYAFIRLYARDRGLTAEVADWIGRDLFDLDDPLPSSNLPRVDEAKAGLMATLNNPAARTLSNHDFYGYFCGPTRLWGNRREEFRALFQPGRKIAPLLGRALETIARKGKTLVALHLRRGDFGNDRFWVAPASWYTEWLDGIWDKLDDPVLYIATDDVRELAAFEKFLPLTSDALGVDIPGAEFYVDHFVLSRAKHLATSNSTFSFTAAMLNRDIETTVRPDPVSRRLVAIDPWDAEVLIDLKDTGELPAQEREIIRTLIKPSGIVLYVGEYCSAWTTVARATHPDLVVIESPDGQIDRLREKYQIGQLTDVVIERPDDIAAVLSGGAESLGYARIDSLHFHIANTESAADIVRRLTELEYAVFRMGPSAMLEPIVAGSPPKTGHYFAVHRRLLPLLFGKKLPGLDLVSLCSEHGIKVRGALHVGAHEGQEISTYDALKVQRVLFVEANPAVFRRLEQAMAERSHVICVNRAICDRPGPVKLHLASFDQSSSLYSMAHHRDVYPQIMPAGTVDVEGITLDALIESLGLSFSDFNFLHMDVQGAELLVLKGAGRALQGIDVISVEVNFANLYEGGAQIEDVENLLRPLGFRRAATISAFHASWGDAFYVRAVAASGAPT